jgi:hypothetical protein
MVGGALLVLVLVWGLDLRAHDGQVVRNTRLGGRDIGGMTRAQVAQIVEQVAIDFHTAEIRVEADGGGFATDASTLGVSVGEPATITAAFDVGRTGSVVSRLAGWMRSLVAPRNAALRVRVDVGAVYRTVRDEDPGPRDEPTEPRIALREGRLTAVDGKDGRGIDPADVIDELPDVAARGEPFVVEVERGDVEPRWATEDVEALIVQARQLVDEPLRITADGRTARVSAATARSWLRSKPTDAGLELVVDPKTSLSAMAELLAEAGTPATETTFAVEGGAVQIIAGKAGTKCCAPSAVDRVERALLHEGDPGETVELPLTAREPELTEAEARDLGITEVVGTFRTPHRAGEPRVHNIHRIADLVRGAVILPGKSFSVNGKGGRRTTDQGFRSAERRVGKGGPSEQTYRSN